MYSFILGLILGGAVVWLMTRQREGSRVINPEMARQKRENLKKVLELVKTKGQISNDDVEKSLGVSDATATNYLSELEKQGQLAQVGQSGRFVRYRLNG
jgi:Fic family protein